MKKKTQQYEENRQSSRKQNFPIKLKNNERGRNTAYNNETSQQSLDSPIKRLKLSREELKDSNPENIDSATIQKNLKKENRQQQSEKNLRLKENIKKDKEEDKWSHEEESQSSGMPQQKQEDLSKIQVGNQQIIELPVEKASSSDQNLSQEQDQINQMDSQKSEPHQLPNMKQTFPKFQKSQTPFQETKRSVSQIPSNLHYIPNHQYKSDRAQIRHSRSITDSIMSPQFQKYLGQSRKSHFRRKLSSPQYPHKGYHHNQYPLMVQSQTLPKAQNAHYRTTFIKQELKITLANNLDKILFKYNGGHARILYNNKLKIKNDSPVNVQVKIMCTYPSHYEVRPFASVILIPSQVLDLLIQMKLYVHDLNHLTMKHDLSQYKNDKFKICYWANEFCSEIWYERGEKVLPVVIEDTEEQRIRSQGLIKSQNNEELKMIAGEKNILMYKAMIEQTKKKIKFFDLQINDPNQNQLYSRYFTKYVFWLIIIIGFAIGYCLG